MMDFWSIFSVNPQRKKQNLSHSGQIHLVRFMIK